MTLFPRIVGYGTCAANLPGCLSRQYSYVALYIGKVCLYCYRTKEGKPSDDPHGGPEEAQA